MAFTSSNILKDLGRTSGDFAAQSGLGGPRGGAVAGNAFSQLMKRRTDLATAESTAAGQEDPKRVAQAEKAAGDLVSNALILPILKQLRRSPWGENTVFSPGIGEKAFGPQFDMQISDRIAHSPRLGIKTALTQRLIKRGQGHVAGKSDKPTTVPASTRLDTHG